ncbi:hypothetical protein ABW20_dc0109633 [Dactylellina cionopaga]|nr:hypothetical protein ABW20_dc0109633 [Dactylellina cionopaga]
MKSSNDDDVTTGARVAPAAAWEPSLFETVETPTVVMTAGTSMEVLYVGVNSLCVERDGCLYLRGLLPTFCSFNSGKARELQIPLPSGVSTRDIKKAFGTRWAFLGIILSGGTVYTFSLKKWAFTRFDSTIVKSGVDDIQVNRIGELCFLYSDYSGNNNNDGGVTLNSKDGSVINIFPPIDSVSDYLYDASLQSFIDGDIEPISSFRLPVTPSAHGGFYGSSNPQERFTTIAATSTGFIALTSNGSVYTYGDGRFNSLGRVPSATLKSSQQGDGHTTAEDIATNGVGWGQVTALDGVVIRHVTANPGGHVQLALADDGTGYIWGGDGTENISTSNIVKFGSKSESEDEGEEVSMLDIFHPATNEPLEFENIAVGEDHVVMVEIGGRAVWTSGGGEMAQTGFGREGKYLPAALRDEDGRMEKGRWRRWEDGVVGGRVMQAECGFGCSLVVIDMETGDNGGLADRSR